MVKSSAIAEFLFGVLYVEMANKIKTNQPVRWNNCGAGEETLTLDLFLGKEAL